MEISACWKRRIGVGLKCIVCPLGLIMMIVGAANGLPGEFTASAGLIGVFAYFIGDSVVFGGNCIGFFRSTRSRSHSENE